MRDPQVKDYSNALLLQFGINSKSSLAPEFIAWNSYWINHCRPNTFDKNHQDEALPSTPAPKQPSNKKKGRFQKVERLSESISDDQIGLGLAFRWFLLLASLYVHDFPVKPPTRDQMIEDIDVLTFSQFCDSVGRQVCSIRNIFKLGTKDSIKSPFLLHKAYTNTLNLRELCKQHRMRYPKIGMTTDRFLCRVTGAKAYLQFFNMLIHGGNCISSNSSLIAPTPYFQERSSGSQEHDAMAALMNELKVTHDGKPIIGVTLQDAPQGLRAIAHEIAARVDADPEDFRPCILIPVSTQEAPHDIRRDVDYIATILIQFLSGKKVNPSDNNLPDEFSASNDRRSTSFQSTGATDKLLFARSLLAKTNGAIIVFVGHDPVSGLYPNLVRAIRHSSSLQLVLDILVHPLISDTPPDSALKAYQRTHIAILSGGKLDISPVYRRREILFTQPDAKHSAAILALHIGAAENRMRGARNAENRINQFKSALLDRSSGVPGESKLAAFCQGLSVGQIAPIPNRGEKLEWDENIIHLMVTGITSELDLLRLRFIALSESGVKKETLELWTMVWIDSVEKSTFSLPSELAEYKAQLYSQMNSSVDDFLWRYRFILVVTRGRGAERGIESRFHPYAYPSYPNGASSIAQSALENPNFINAPTDSISYMYPEIRDAVLSDISSHTRKQRQQYEWEPYLLRQIIAAEGLRQHVIQRRIWAINQSIDPSTFRRIFETLYNGFLSLPPFSLHAASENWPQITWPAGFSGTPEQIFKMLYEILFREILDGNSAHRLSRQFGFDAVRLDLLRLAHSAFSDQVNQSPFQQHPAWANTQTQPGQKFLIDHYVSAGISARRIGKYAKDDGRFVVERLQEFRDDPMETGLRNRLHKTIADFEFENLGYFERDAKNGSLAALDFCKKHLEDQHIDLRFIEDLLNKNSQLMIGDPSLSREIEDSAKRVIATCRAIEEVEEVSDWLSRYADLLYEQSQAYLKSGNWNENTENTKKRGAYALAAYTATVTAKKIREEGRGSNFPQLEPHLTPLGLRVLARSGLELVRILRTNEERLTQISSSRLFELIQEIRTALDWYALKYGGFAPEQVTMLLLESRFARTVGEISEIKDGNSEARHLVALGYIRRAELAMFGFGFRPRLTVRMLLERCATVRGLGTAVYDKIRQLPSISEIQLRVAHTSFPTPQASQSSQKNSASTTDGRRDMEDYLYRTEELERSLRLTQLALIDAHHARGVIQQIFGWKTHIDATNTLDDEGWHLQTKKQIDATERRLNDIRALLQRYMTLYEKVTRHATQGR
ncbi:hypothetical protein ACO0LO_10420 [Undibacterium sp. TJN25]|uniref:hypothetical protein n=1 Tax=Undibacterium sp. TJN25 TaxID=3413056 RepID=UPI003BF0150C